MIKKETNKLEISIFDQKQELEDRLKGVDDKIIQLNKQMDPLKKIKGLQQRLDELDLIVESISEKLDKM